MSSIEDAVCRKIQRRAALGLRKYGVPLEKTHLSEFELLVHAQEEAMDLANYLETLIQNKQKKPVAYLTTDRKMIIFSDSVEDPAGMTPLYEKDNLA
jgi:hypothetical protein